ncbi:hypothetical protein BDV40DRAFT_181654 [Aspergillus tamarii]|uniref:Uncharacterized protein n=1 Tax=Aspergillus tamarii TaxID=41984 RepID=A0A5N6US72_ASPTM|nr:hypothetical protein BDV40DRAFT_181654 [Aspergillus tamarii]
MRFRCSCRGLKSQGIYCCGMWQHQGSAKRMVFSHQSLISCALFPPISFCFYLYVFHVCECACSHTSSQSNQYLLFCTRLRCTVLKLKTHKAKPMYSTQRSWILCIVVKT